MDGRTIYLQFFAKNQYTPEDHWRNKIVYPKRIRVKNVESVFATIAQIAIMRFYGSPASEFPSLQSVGRIIIGKFASSIIQHTNTPGGTHPNTVFIVNKQLCH